VLEKVAAEYADKGVKLVKVNVDEEQFIAAQFQVKSIPTVYAMFQGQPVADLTQARTESQLKQMLDQILSQLPVEGGADEGAGQQQPDIEQFVSMAQQVLADGDAERAAGVFSQIVDMAPDNATAQAGLVRALVAAGRVEEARAALDAMPDTLTQDGDVQAAKSALDLAGEAPQDDGELASLAQAWQTDETNMQAGLDYASAAFAAGQRDAAADTLLTMIARDPDWEEGAAKAKLLQIFEAVGLEDPWVSATRRRLSLLLFG
jgi:putative thioredoxin